MDTVPYLSLIVFLVPHLGTSVHLRRDASRAGVTPDIADNVCIRHVCGGDVSAYWRDDNGESAEKSDKEADDSVPDSNPARQGWTSKRRRGILSCYSDVIRTEERYKKKLGVETITSRAVRSNACNAAVFRVHGIMKWFSPRRAVHDTEFGQISVKVFDWYCPPCSYLMRMTEPTALYLSLPSSMRNIGALWNFQRRKCF